MCNLYSHTKPIDAVRRHFGVTRAPATNLPPQPSIFPKGVAPVVRPIEGGRELALLRWGVMIPIQGKAKPVTNARDDKIRANSFAWRFHFQERRCLVPATSFCEPKGKKPAIWHWFALSPDGEDERPHFAFAGLWQAWEGGGRLRGRDLRLPNHDAERDRRARPSYADAGYPRSRRLRDMAQRLAGRGDRAGAAAAGGADAGGEEG